MYKKCFALCIKYDIQQYPSILGGLFTKVMRLAQNLMIFQPQALRRLYDNNVSIVHPPETVVGRYFPNRRFITAVQSGALYFRRLDSFQDQLEGQPTQSLWEVESDSILQWYESNRRSAFVSCWNLDGG